MSEIHFSASQCLRAEILLPFKESVNVGALSEWIKRSNPSASVHVENITYPLSLGLSFE